MKILQELTLFNSKLVYMQTLLKIYSPIKFLINLILQ
jgi:hypothetical protein